MYTAESFNVFFNLSIDIFRLEKGFSGNALFYIMPNLAINTTIRTNLR
jgi:hypothetical protein